jgi:hypothetical protein
MRMASMVERTAREEHRWPAAVGLLTAMALYATLPSPFLPGLRYTVVALGLVLLVPLIVVNPVRFQRQTRWSRHLSISETFLLAGANQVALVQVVNHLIHPGGLSGQRLLLSALQVWVTNVIVFALVYWEIDRGGPVARSREQAAPGLRPDLHFVQDEEGVPSGPSLRSAAPRRWRPDFLDYLFTSLWTSTAFSPTDAMPLTHRIKAIMALESISGLVVFALVVGRSVNIFS